MVSSQHLILLTKLYHGCGVSIYEYKKHGDFCLKMTMFKEKYHTY